METQKLCCCNGKAERTVKTLFKNSADSQLSLFSYRSTPLPWCRLSPAELLMGRKIRTDLPQTSESLTPWWSYLPQFRKDNKAFKEKQKEVSDRCHCTRSLPELPEDTSVWVTTNGNPTQGTVVNTSTEPRSYIVETPSSNIRRNRSHLNVAPDTQPTMSQPDSCQSPIRICSRTGTAIIPPERL